MTQIDWAALASQATTSTGDYTPMPEGDYDLKVIESKLATTQTGKLMYKLTYEVQTGEFARRRVWDNLVVSPENDKAMGIFWSKMRILGLQKDWFEATKPSSEQIAQAVMGRPIRAHLGLRTWNDNVQNEITRYLAAPTQQFSPTTAGATVPPVAPPAPAVAPGVATAPPPPAPVGTAPIQGGPPAPPF
jgi:hypothetical protein